MRIGSLGIALYFLSSVACAASGPLNPPPGPVTSTFKSLQQVEPRIDVATLGGDAMALRVIGQSGSYYLSGDLQTEGSQSAAVDVRANDVTLDLNGFMISSTAVACVRIQSGLSNVTIRNGSLLTYGIALDGSGAIHARVEALNISGAQRGIVLGSRAYVENCSVYSGSVGGDRIVVGAGSILTHCRTWSLVHPAAYATGVVLGDSSRASECVAEGGGIGFTLGTAASLVECSASNTSNAGISAGTNVSVSGCTVQFCPRGIVMDTANRVERCKIGNASTAIQCTTANTLVNNTMNAAAVNSGTGINLLSEHNRVEGNDIYAFATGVSVGGGHNVLLHNIFQQVGLGASGGGLANSIVPIASTTAELASNPQANIWQ